MIREDWARTERIARCFPTRWLQGYARGKLWTDPVYRASWERIGASLLPLLDVGCGCGLHAFYLREQGFKGEITGLDSDARKITEGQQATAQGRYIGVHLREGDCGSLPPFEGHVAMLDVLQYISLKAQSEVLTALASRVAPGGWCIIRTTPQSEGWRFRMTSLIEMFAHRIHWMERPVMAFPTVESIVAHFPPDRFLQDIGPMWGRTPFNSWLLAFRRHDQQVTSKVHDTVASAEPFDKASRRSDNA